MGAAVVQKLSAPKPDSVAAWGCASFIVLAAWLAQHLLSSWSGVGLPPFIGFYPAVVLGALAGGPRVGIATALASLAIAWWFFMQGFSAASFSPPIIVPSSIFLITSTFLGWTVGKARLALDRAKLREQMQTYATRESIHRTKNVLAVVQAMVRKVYREVGSMEEYRDVLTSRLVALGNAQDVLIQRDWIDLPVADLVSFALAPFLPNPGLAVRPGPAVTVPAKHVTGLCLALFELATNSMKYGALEDGRGPVLLTWQFDDGCARLEWNETTPVQTEKPEGSGSRLVRGAMSGEAGSTVRYHRTAHSISASFRWRVPSIATGNPESPDATDSPNPSTNIHGDGNVRI